MTNVFLFEQEEQVLCDAAVALCPLLCDPRSRDAEDALEGRVVARVGAEEEERHGALAEEDVVAVAELPGLGESLAVDGGAGRACVAEDERCCVPDVGVADAPDGRVHAADGLVAAAEAQRARRVPADGDVLGAGRHVELLLDAVLVDVHQVRLARRLRAPDAAPALGGEVAVGELDQAHARRGLP